MRNFTVLSGIFGITGIVFGAFGAHALNAILLERGTRGAWETAVFYHLLHAATLFGLAAWHHREAPSANRNGLVWAGRCWTAGIILFSGSIYGLALGGPRWLGPITPLGGIAFMIGWLCVIVHGASRARPSGKT